MIAGGDMVGLEIEGFVDVLVFGTSGQDREDVVWYEEVVVEAKLYRVIGSKTPRRAFWKDEVLGK